MKSNIIMIGMPGSGKSTVGKLLSNAYQMTFIDTDELIEINKGMTPKKIVENEGMNSFLTLQEAIILGINEKNAIISTGGSVVLSETSMKHLSKHGTIVYLEASYDSISKRVGSNRRFAAKSSDLLALYNKRRPSYERYAEITLDCNHKLPNQIIQDFEDIYIANGANEK